MLYKSPILELFNMPKSAQNFPTRDDIIDEKGDDLQVFQCSGCGLVQLNAIPVPYYKDVIRAAAYSSDMKEYRVNQFNKFLKKYKLKNKKLLEVGCGKGEYLSIMKQCGADVYGIEHLKESVDVCILDSLQVTKDYIDTLNYKNTNSPFDGFFILNFLEHIPDINSLLKGIVNNLTEDGIGLVEVPNFDMILEKNLFSEFISDHLYYFTKNTLIRTLEINGFEVLECKNIWYDYIVSVVVRKRKKLDLSIFRKKRIDLSKELHNFIDDYENVAIWGAGHQALAVIALTEIQNKIRFVIDSAPFKQGFYTPGTHLEIVSPHKLDNSIDAIVVMAASYSDEIAKIIEDKYKDINVAILRDDGLEIINIL